MKKLSVNKNDCSFVNRYKFEDLLNHIKALGGSIIKNSKETCILGLTIGCLIFSASSIYNLGTGAIELIEYYKTASQRDLSISNGEFIAEANKECIIVANNIDSTVEPKYSFKDNNLYDNEGNIIFLNGVSKEIIFVNCNINNETFENIQLSSSKATQIDFDYSSIDNDFVNYLPSTLEYLSINNCQYITDLSRLPKRYPNIKGISLNAMSSLSDFSFIYELPNLKEIYLSDSAYVTKELLDYLRDNNITTNISEQDIINSQKIDAIIRNIITPNMSDREKIQAVCLYVLNNVEYDINQNLESNITPLTCVLEDGKGVCASYAYLTNVLLNKAGIKAFEVTNDSHGWNMIKLDDKYYYIDTTNMDGSAFYNFLLKVLNISKYYIIDTEATFTTPMSKSLDEKAIIPLSLIKDIEAGRNEKDIFEKYGSQVGNICIILGYVLNGIAISYAPSLLKKVIMDTTDLYYSIKYDYEDKIEEYKATK